MGVNTMNEQLRLLRIEFNRPSFKERLRETKGCKCGNCGSDELVEYHHVVALADGGTNNLSNIVPLCYKCHSIAHGSKTVRERHRATHSGRPRRTFSKEDKMYFYMYFHNVIGKKALMKFIGLINKHLTDHPWYEEMKQKCKAPEDFYNNIDLLEAKQRSREGRAYAKYK